MMAIRSSIRDRSVKTFKQYLQEQVRVERMGEPEEGTKAGHRIVTHHFTVHHPNLAGGKTHLSVEHHPEYKTAWMNAWGNLDNANKLGVSSMRHVIKAIKKHIPDVEELKGVRTTGARGNKTTFRERLQTIRVKKLDEAWHKSMPKPAWNREGGHTDIYKNPTHAEMKELSGHGNAVGAFLHGNDMYAFHRFDALHHDVAKHLKLDNTAIPLSVFHDRHEASAIVTDHSRNTHWHHSPVVHDAIVHHPHMKKLYKGNVDVDYYDSAIHGKWHEKGFDP
jgi:hypothetical protein